MLHLPLPSCECSWRWRWRWPLRMPAQPELTPWRYKGEKGVEGQQLLPQHLHSRVDGPGSWQSTGPGPMELAGGSAAAHGCDLRLPPPSAPPPGPDGLHVHGDPELTIQDTKPKLLLTDAQTRKEKMMPLVVTNKYPLPLSSLQELWLFLFVFF